MTNVVTCRPPAAAASASSGPVSFGYSELENNNQMSLASSVVGDLSLQTPNVEYSSTSLKKEILVSDLT